METWLSFHDRGVVHNMMSVIITYIHAILQLRHAVSFRFEN